MNIAYFLTPRMNVACLQDDWTVRQGLAMLRSRGYASIPVVTAENHYLGTLSEGDFLWYLLDNRALFEAEPESWQRQRVGDVVRAEGRMLSVRITETMERMMELVLIQNFVPVVDDLGGFVGIVTRRRVVEYLLSRKPGGGTKK